MVLDCGKDFEADMLLRMLKSEHRGLREWAASMVARAFTAVALKRSFCRLKGCRVLVSLLKYVARQLHTGQSWGTHREAPLTTGLAALTRTTTLKCLLHCTHC